MAMHWFIGFVGGLSVLAWGCSSSVVDENLGASCVPGQENEPDFRGIDIGDTIANRVSSGRVCLGQEFQGRVSCPEGQPEPVLCDGGQSCPLGQTCTEGVCVSPSSCFTPDGEPVTTEVCGQCEERGPELVYWTCPCRRGDRTAADDRSLCECPATMTCSEQPVVVDLDAADPTFYCVKPETVDAPYSRCSISGFDCR
ncbi:MAG: hypothetical protein AAGA56_25095 [Myxococcota bacterium]